MVPPGQTVTAGPPANHVVLLTVSVLSAGAAQAGPGEQSLEYNKDVSKINTHLTSHSIFNSLHDLPKRGFQIVISLESWEVSSHEK